MSKSYLNKVELKGGEVILFHRPNAKKPIYHMRIHVRGMQDVHGDKLTYIQESTGEQDLEEAQRVALNRYDDLRLRAKAKQPAKAISWADMYELWFREKRQALEAHYRAKGRTGRNARAAWYEKYSERYWLPYFGRHSIEDITQRQVAEYWTWRQNYWANATDAERKQFANFALNPSKKTLDMEQSALREIFGWANANKLLNHMPIIQNPYSRKGLKPVRRASFEREEFDQLVAYMSQWSAGRGVNDGRDGARVNSAHLYQRELLRLYVLWLATTGMRTGEALQLRHRDIEINRTEETKSVLLKINVSHQTKTGSRVVKSLPETVVVYEDICTHTGREELDDWLFCNLDGTRNQGFFKTLPKMLEEAGVLHDANGNRRSAYSFRHYYAEQRLRVMQTNPRALDILSVNMGTGKQMLESFYVRRDILADDEVLIVEADPRKRGRNTRLDGW